MSDQPKRLNVDLLRQAAESDPNPTTKELAKSILWLLEHRHTVFIIGPTSKPGAQHDHDDNHRANLS